MEETLQHEETTQCIGLPPSAPGNHRPDGSKADHALTFKLDHSMGTEHSLAGAGFGGLAILVMLCGSVVDVHLFSVLGREGSIDRCLKIQVGLTVGEISSALAY